MDSGAAGTDSGFGRPIRRTGDQLVVERMIHASAEIEPDVVLGDGVKVWHFCHVRTGARIGAGTSLGRNVFVDAGVGIGERCRVQNNVSVYSGVTLEHEVFVGPGVIFTNDTLPRASSKSWLLRATLVRRGASLGGGCVIVSPRDIGEYAMVGAGAVVTRDVPDHSLVVGNPARVRGWVCRCGRVVSRKATRPLSFACAGCEDEESV